MDWGRQKVCLKISSNLFLPIYNQFVLEQYWARPVKWTLNHKSVFLFYEFLSFYNFYLHRYLPKSKCFFSFLLFISLTCAVALVNWWLKDAQLFFNDFVFQMWMQFFKGYIGFLLSENWCFNLTYKVWSTRNCREKSAKLWTPLSHKRLSLNDLGITWKDSLWK